MKVAVVGRGKLGRALARALDAQVVPGRSRARTPLDVDVVVLAVPDAQIARVTRALAPRLPARSTVLHTAGARGCEALAEAEARGLATGVLHPLVSFASRRHPAPLHGATFPFSAPRAPAAPPAS